MICSNCGKEIKDGASYCLECGASIDEPVVLSDVSAKNVDGTSKSGQAKGKAKYDGPFLDFSGYVKSLGNDTSVLVGLLAAILVYLSPFFTWMWIEHFGVKKSANLFELGAKNGEMAINAGILTVMAILLMLSALDMLAFSGCKYVGPLKSFENNYLVRILPVIMTVIFLIIILNCDNYVLKLDSIVAQREKTAQLGSELNFDGGKGVGIVLLIAGQVLYTISVLIDYVKRKK